MDEAVVIWITAVAMAAARSRDVMALPFQVSVAIWIDADLCAGRKHQSLFPAQARLEGYDHLGACQPITLFPIRAEQRQAAVGDFCHRRIWLGQPFRLPSHCWFPGLNYVVLRCRTYFEVTRSGII